MKPENNNYKQSKALTNLFLVSGLFYAGLKYREFLNFIKKLTLGINVKNIYTNTATFFLSSINSLGVPYKIKSIRFFNEDLVIGGIIKSEDLNRKIVKNSRIPITIKLENPVTKEVLENSKIAICFVYALGITETIFYDLKSTIQSIENPVTVDITPIEPESLHNNCGCNHLKNY